MKTEEAIEICKGWLKHLDEQAAKTKQMQRLAAHARKGPKEAKQAQREMRILRGAPKVYCAGRLRPAVELLIRLRTG